MTEGKLPHGVLYVSSVSGMGGAEFSLLELATHLDRTHFRPFLLVSEDGLLAQRFRAAGIQTIYGDFPFFSRRQPWVYLKSIWRIVSVVRRCGVSLVHVNCDRAVPHAVLATRLAGVPCLCHIHDMIRAWFLPSYVRYLNWSDRIVADSRATARRCVAAGMDQRKLSVIYECFEMERYSSTGDSEREAFRQEFGLSNRHVAIGLVGQVLRSKGHEEFVRAAMVVASECSEAMFFVVGDDAMSSDKGFLIGLRRLVGESGLDGKFVFTGYRSDIPRVMAGLDIVTVPSLEEPFGRVVVEALAARRPVVASRGGGVPEIIEHGVTGFLFPPKDYEAMAEYLLQLCRSPELRARMGERGPEAVARFDVGEHVRQFEELYLELLENNRTRTAPGRNLKPPLGE